MSFASKVKYSCLTNLDDDVGSKAAVDIKDNGFVLMNFR